MRAVQIAEFAFDVYKINDDLTNYTYIGQVYASENGNLIIESMPGESDNCQLVADSLSYQAYHRMRGNLYEKYVKPFRQQNNE